MKNILFKSVTLGTFLKQIPYYIFIVTISGFLLLVGIHLFQGKFSETDVAMIAAAGWAFMTMIYWLYARQVEKISEANLAIINQKEIEVGAWRHSYERLMETLITVDKDILRRYGVHISLEKKRTVN